MFMVKVVVEHSKINKWREDRWTREPRMDQSPWVQRKRLVLV